MVIMILGYHRNINHLIIFIGGPSVVAFWRGTWDYANIWYDDFIFKKDYDLSNGLAIFLGLLLNFLLDMFHRCVLPLAGQVRRDV